MESGVNVVPENNIIFSRSSDQCFFITNPMPKPLPDNRRQSDTPQKRAGVTTQLSMSILGVTSICLRTGEAAAVHC